MGKSDHPVIEPWTLAKYAEVRAVLRHFRQEPRSVVLHALRIVDAQWLAVDAHFRRHIDEELSAGRQASVLAFDATFNKVLEELVTSGGGLEAVKARGYGV